jgi:hypothetical protein
MKWVRSRRGVLSAKQGVDYVGVGPKHATQGDLSGARCKAIVSRVDSHLPRAGSQKNKMGAK